MRRAKFTGGAKIYRMALSNLYRNRKRTLLVILSMTLSLVLFHTMFTLSGGFDIETDSRHCLFRCRRPDHRRWDLVFTYRFIFWPLLAVYPF